MRVRARGARGYVRDGRRGGSRTRGLWSLEGAARAPTAARLTSSTVRRGRCSVPSSSLSFTADERPWKQRRMLSMTAAVSRDAMLGGAHSSSVAPSLLCSHRPVSLSRMDAILGGESRTLPSRHLMKTPTRPRRGPPTWRRPPGRAAVTFPGGRGLGETLSSDAEEGPPAAVT